MYIYIIYIYIYIYTYVYILYILPAIHTLLILLHLAGEPSLACPRLSPPSLPSRSPPCSIRSPSPFIHWSWEFRKRAAASASDKKLHPRAFHLRKKNGAKGKKLTSIEMKNFAALRAPTVICKLKHA